MEIQDEVQAHGGTCSFTCFVLYFDELLFLHLLFLLSCSWAGRVNLLELVSILNVDLCHIEAKTTALIQRFPNKLSLINGQIIAE